MSKEKFELVFLAGGAMLNVLSNRLRRPPQTPREEVGAAMHAVRQLCQEHRDRLDDPAAVDRQLTAIRDGLTVERPDTILLAGYIGELASLVSDVPELATPVRQLGAAVRGYLG
jgi:hypothetical protein